MFSWVGGPRRERRTGGRGPHVGEESVEPDEAVADGPGCVGEAEEAAAGGADATVFVGVGGPLVEGHLERDQHAEPAYLLVAEP